MTRPMLSVCSVLLFGACSFAAVAADSTNTQTSNATEAVRARVEKQRDQLSGVDKVAVPSTKTSSIVLDAPVDTSDAPALVQKP